MSVDEMPSRFETPITNVGKQPVNRAFCRVSVYGCWSALLVAVAIFGGSAGADDRFGIFAEFGASSGLIDKGEHVSGKSLDVAAGVNAAVPVGTVYAGIYRRLPLGMDQQAFHDEADYTLGIVMEGDVVIADLSASWITYPGESVGSSLEFVGDFEFKMPLSPRVIGFHDADLEGMGIEATAGPRWEVSEWDIYARARAGFVDPGSGSKNRSYTGVELGASKPVASNMEFGFVARLEATDEASYVAEVHAGSIIRLRSTGVAARVFLSVIG